ncbi:hypothetical protein GJ744_000019 [Endocarpon pusillum]|uniref:Uncharacterized protein n=1 Tax=Endocarpon pusillum TaxID=364733 RepID=A0A8H7AVF2_9EURO|nr:hypothetical protein GJ744_000019 [Endocarpon pusillum]
MRYAVGRSCHNERSLSVQSNIVYVVDEARNRLLIESKLSQVPTHLKLIPVDAPIQSFLLRSDVDEDDGHAARKECSPLCDALEEYLSRRVCGGFLRL